jgi:hypothetical protein
VPCRDELLTSFSNCQRATSGGYENVLFSVFVNGRAALAVSRYISDSGTIQARIFGIFDIFE